MTETDKRRDGGVGGGPDDLLEAAFGAARAEAARPAPADLLARIEDDALRLQPRAAAPIRGLAPTSGGLAAAVGRLLSPIGGWPAFGGLVTATVTGLWLGVSPPAAVAAQGGWLGSNAAIETLEADLAQILPDDFFAEEG
jgi:hypothetical protein